MKSDQHKKNNTASAEVIEKVIRKNALMKLVVMGVFIAAIIAFQSIAWFTMNREVSGNGMNMKAEGMPYTIQTRDNSGYYKDKWEKTGSEAVEWLVSSDKNFDNKENGLNNEEDKLGLEPGDSGVLEFRVNPNSSDSITVDCVFDVKAYLETVVKDENGNVTIDEDSNPVTKITEINSDALTGYIKSHIMLFSGYDSERGKYTGLIDNDKALRRVLENQTYTKNDTSYTTIYWVWPMHLEDITSNNNSKLIYASEERKTVIAYIARNRDGFFKDCNNSEQQVISDLTALSTSYDNTIYNHYNMRYDNADLEIGNNISYVMLSMNVEQ